MLNGKILSHFDNTISWDLEWSTQSSMMAMSNHFGYAEPPDRNLTLFIDPFAGLVCGYTYGHRGQNEETYTFSPSGRWLASTFAQEYFNNEGTIILPSTVALTDLSPILPLSVQKPL
jgi:hypothetical protein